MAIKSPFVSIVIVHFNNKKLIKRCLDSLWKTGYPKARLEIIVVDNASTDDSVKFIKHKYKKVKVIENRQNNYCQACNLGILESRGSYVVLLNNDVVVKKGWLSELVKPIEKDRSVGAVSSMLLEKSGLIQNAGLYELPNFYWDERGAGKKPKEFNYVTDLEAVCGASVLYRKSALRDIGLFDEDFLMFGEDVDMSIRFRKKGWRLIFAPSSVAYHKKHGSCNEEFSREAIEKNRLLFIAKHYPDKLAKSLIGNSYFIANKDNLNSGRFFDLTAQVFLKLLKEHGRLISDGIIKDLFEELKNITNYENKKMEMELKSLLDDLIGTKKDRNWCKMQEEKYQKDIELDKKQISSLSSNLHDKENIIQDSKRRIEELSSQLSTLHNDKENIIQDSKRRIEELSSQLSTLHNDKENIIQEKEHKIKQLSEEVLAIKEELGAYKEEISKLTDKLKISLDEGTAKDDIILDKTSQLNNVTSKLDEARKQLLGIYNSEGYRFILSPLWKIMWHMRATLKYAAKKAAVLVWTAMIFFISPILLAHALLFTLEVSLELFFGKLSRYFRKKREIVHFDNLTVSVVIPNWNGLNFLKKCLSSLCEADGFKEDGYEILVVDDASSQSIAMVIKDDFPKVRVIRNRGNQGFGKTCNRGVREAKGELIVLLNNDIMVSRGFLDPLKAHFKDPEVFAVSPKLYYWDMKSFNYGMHMGKFKDGYLNLWNEAETGNSDKVSQTSPTVFAVGGAMCFRKKDFLWMGGFDDIYRPNCWEDIDVSYRAQKRGLKVLYEPNSIMYHKGAATLNYVRHKEIKNELLFMWKNLRDNNMVLSHFNNLPKFLLKGRHSTRLTFLIGYVWALNYIIPALVNRFKEFRYAEVKDKRVLDRSLLYYRNFMRNNFVHSDKKTVLLITPFIPYPLNSGGKIRMYNLYKRLSKNYDIVLLSLAHHEKDSEYAKSNSMKDIFKEIHLIDRQTKVNEFLFPNRYRHSFSSFLIEKLNEIQGRLSIDLAHIESNELLYLTRFVKHIPIVYTEHDISILSPHKSYYKKNTRYVLPGIIDYMKIVHSHNSFYKNLDKIIVLSKEDMRVVRVFSPNSDFSYVPTGVDIEHFEFKDKTGRDKSLIFVGHYPHYPNEEAAVYFCRKIFPLIKKLIPEATVKLVGSGPTENVLRLSSIKGVEVIGDVPDVKPYLHNASLFVCASRVGAGIKGKILEAMATGTPVVSTTRGSCGIDAENGFNILISDKPKDFARYVTELFNNDALYKRIARQARLLVEEKYDWNKVVQKLDNIYADVMEIDRIAIRPEGSVIKPVGADKRLPSSDSIMKDIVKKTDDIIKLSLDYLNKEYSKDINMKPEELHVELTHLCNSKCITCDIWDIHKRTGKSVKDEISLDDIKKLLSGSNALKGIKTVVLSGGEPFLRPDFVDICFAIKDTLPQASLGILTNGINTEVIVSKMKQILKKIKTNAIWIGSSLDGLGDAYDKIRGVDGGFSGFVKTLEFFKKELPEVRFSLTFVLTPFNTDQLVPCWEFADKNGIDFFAQFGVPKESRQSEVFKWSNKDLERIEGHIGQILERIIRKVSSPEDFYNNMSTVRGKINLFTKIYYWSHLVDFQKTKSRFAYDCNAGFKFVMLDPYGNMFFCPLLKEKTIGNIRDNKMDYIWDSNKACEVRDFIDSGKCSCWLVCTVFPIIGKALALHGDKAAIEVLASEQSENLTFRR